MAKTQAKPWQKRKGETPPAWEAFKLYRDMGAEHRSQAKVAERLGKSVSLMNRWSSRHDWDERAHEFDLDQDARHVASLDEEREEMRRRHIELATMGLEVLKLELEKFVRDATQLNGKTLDPDQAMKFLDLCSKVERMNRGEPTTHVKVESETKQTIRFGGRDVEF